MCEARDQRAKRALIAYPDLLSPENIQSALSRGAVGMRGTAISAGVSLEVSGEQALTVMIFLLAKIGTRSLETVHWRETGLTQDRN